MQTSPKEENSQFLVPTKQVYQITFMMKKEYTISTVCHGCDRVYVLLLHDLDYLQWLMEP